MIEKFNKFCEKDLWAKKLVKYGNGVILCGLFEKNTLGENASYLTLSNGHMHSRILALEELLNMGCSLIKIENEITILKNNQRGMFFDVNFSHTNGDVLIDSKQDFKIFDKKGRLM